LASALIEVQSWNARIDDVEQDFIDRANNLDATYPTRLVSVEQQLAEKAEQEDLSVTELNVIAANARIDALVINSGDANAEVSESHVSATKNTTYTTLKNRLDANEKELRSVGQETNIIELNPIVVGSRLTVGGDIMSDELYFRTVAIPVVVGDRYASVSASVGILPNYYFFNVSTISSANLVIRIQARDAVVPSGATHMVIYYNNAYFNGFVVKKMASDFPVYGAKTFVYTDVLRADQTYTRTDIDGKDTALDAKITTNTNDLKTKLNSDALGVETNLLKLNTVTLIDGFRTDNSGNLMTDAAFFRSTPIQVAVGERLSATSSDLAVFPRYAFYNSDTLIPANFISVVTAREAVVPAGATRLVIAYTLALKSSLIVKKMTTGFPVLGENTFNYTEIYTIAETDDLLAAKLEEKDLPKWYPGTFELDIVTQERGDRIYVIDDNDVLYGSDGFNRIIKATNISLSDKINVCTLNSGSYLKKLLFVSLNKAIGYVESTVIADVGFYVFENADTNSWTFRRVGVMRKGYPAMEFQSLVKTPDSTYIFASAYSSGADKIIDPLDTTTQAATDVYRSTDLGETWQIVYTHAERLNTHVHAIEWDTYRDRLWICIGDEGFGGMPGWAYSDDYGATFSFVENNDSANQIPFMDTVIIPTRRYVLFGSDYHPAGIRKWEPNVDEKHAIVSNADVTNQYLVPIQTTNNFGFARNPVVDVTSYPYKIAMPISHNADYSHSALFLSPNFRDWYMMDHTATPRTSQAWSAFSGITKTGYVLGWNDLSVDGKRYYRYFKFPEWIEN